MDRLAAALAPHYRLERELGAGGMATVYVAEDLKHRRRVAIKVLRPELAALVGAERFLREIETTAGLHHPHILGLHDSGQAGDVLYYVMPLVEGRSLRDRLAAEPQLPLEEALRIAREVADALGYAHARGLVHRDVKPENILLQGGHALVADFGIAKAVSAAGERLTQTGMAVGSPLYMSPEQAVGGTVDGRADLYALGCVLFEMLAGEPPYTGATAQAVQAKRMLAPIPQVSAVREAVPAALDAVLGRALARSPADRFRTAEDFARALDAAAGQGGPMTTRDLAATVPVGARRWRTLRWPLAALAGVLAIAAVWAAGRRGAAAVPSDLDPRLVAVGDFENATGDSALAPLGRMAADWVVRGLARVDQLKVLDAATLYAAPATGPAQGGALELARRNGAGLAVAGRFYRDGGSLLVSASVLDVATGTVRRSLDPVASRTGEALPAVEELRQRLAAALLAELDPQSGAYLIEPAEPPPTYDAYREFVAAQERYWSGRVLEGVDGFRRAVALDTTFVTAQIWLLNASVTADRCEQVDSVVRALERRRERLTRGDIPTLASGRARCNRDWETHLQLMKERAAAESGAGITRWATGAAARRANRPAEALAILRALRPDRDLGWMSDPGKVMYWREVAWAQHALGDSTGEWRTVEEIGGYAPGRLAERYFRALALAGQGRHAEAEAALDGVEALPSDPALAAGEIAGRLAPEAVATPAWVLHQVATEILAGGDSTRAAAVARRAARWAEGRVGTGRATPSDRFQLALALELDGRLDSAAVVLQALIREDSASIPYRGRLGVVAARRGDRAAAAAVDRWLASQTGRFPPGAPQLERARIAAALGEVARALDLIETLPFGAHPVDVMLFHSDPALGGLRGQERWARWLRPRG